MENPPSRNNTTAQFEIARGRLSPLLTKHLRGTEWLFMLTLKFAEVKTLASIFVYRSKDSFDMIHLTRYWSQSAL